MAMDEHFWAGRVTAAVPLYTSGRISSSVKAAEAGWKAAQAEEHRETLDLKLNVADAYVKVLRATQAVQVAASSVASLSSHSHNVANLYEKGFVAKNDLLASQVVLADARPWAACHCRCASSGSKWLKPASGSTSPRR